MNILMEIKDKNFPEMSRVCKKGGQIIVIVPNSLNLPYRITKKILELNGRWIYGFEKPYTIFELKNRMKSACITPVVAGGVSVISSTYFLLQLIPKRTRRNSDECINNKMTQHFLTLKQIIKWILKHLEKICEVMFGTIFAKDIGVMGIKE